MRTTAAEKVKRDACVVADRARGLTWATIADRVTASVRASVGTFGERAPGTSDYRNLGADTIDEVLAQLDAVIEDVAQLAVRTNNDSVRLGAIKTRGVLIAQKVEMLQALGRLPLLRRLGDEIEFEAITDVMMDIFDRYKLPDQAELDLIEALSTERVGASTRRRRLTFVDVN